MGGRCGRRGTINGGLSFIIQFVDRTVGGLPLHNAVNETLADRLIADLSSLPGHSPICGRCGDLPVYLRTNCSSHLTMVGRWNTIGGVKSRYIFDKEERRPLIASSDNFITPPFYLRSIIMLLSAPCHKITNDFRSGVSVLGIIIIIKRIECLLTDVEE